MEPSELKELLAHASLPDRPTPEVEEQLLERLFDEVDRVLHEGPDEVPVIDLANDEVVQIGTPRRAIWQQRWLFAAAAAAIVVVGFVALWPSDGADETITAVDDEPLPTATVEEAPTSSVVATPSATRPTDLGPVPLDNVVTTACAELSEALDVTTIESANPGSVADVSMELTRLADLQVRHSDLLASSLGELPIDQTVRAALIEHRDSLDRHRSLVAAGDQWNQRGVVVALIEELNQITNDLADAGWGSCP